MNKVQRQRSISVEAGIASHQAQDGLQRLVTDFDIVTFCDAWFFKHV